METYFEQEIKNISLTILAGKVLFMQHNLGDDYQKILNTNDSTSVLSNDFHYVKTISNSPSCFMYTFTSKINRYVYICHDV
jgi:hypothetical protein